MNLAIDIGNTRVKVALFEKDELLEVQIILTNWEKKIIERLTNHSVKNIIISSVGVSLNAKFLKKLSSFGYFLKLTAETPLPIQNLYHTPNTLGKDRIAGAVGAWSRYPQSNSLVVDAGTCITYDLIDAGGNFLGGNISPGIDMRLQAMHHFTARLPRVEKGSVEEWIGRNTQEALRNGAQLGAWLETAQFIDYCESRFGQINVILTGGDADFFANQAKSKIFVHHNLVLEGLNQILNYNAER